MATTENTFTGNGSTTNYSFTFPYIKTTDVKASINGTDTTAFTLANATTVQFNTAPANSAAIRIYRATDDSALPATFYAGSSIKSSDLNDNFLQNLYTNQETNNNVWQTGTETIDSSETWAGNNTKIATTGAIDGRVDAKIDTAMGSDVLAGTDLIKTVSGGQVTVAHNVNGANSTVNNSNGSVVQDITISAQGHVTSVGSIDLDGRYYTETELNAGQLDNRYYTETETGSLIDSKIDTAVTTDILAGQSITKTNGSGQVTISIASGAIGTNQIADDAVTLAKLGSGALPTDITVASANIVNGTIVDADISTGTLDGRYYTETELNAGQLDTRYYTETELNAGQLDNRYYTETEADARFYNLTSGEEIQSGETWSAADNKIATTAAIDARITDLVDDVGGFVPIANETSFPNANPDINNGAGTLVSIKALSSNLTSNGSGVATVTNGTVGNSTVTINGLDNSTTYNAGFGMIVETTTTLNTYTFHRQVPKATEVTTVAGSITNVNNVGNNISNVNTVAGVTSNVTTVAGISSNVTTVAGIASNVTTVAGISSDITAVAADATDIGAVAAKATEIGRLGTADAVSDMNTLGTTAIVSDLDTCSTNISNINNVGGSISNVNTVAGNLSGVNSFGERYRVASSAPGSGNDEGDLYFDTTANELKVYNGSSWQGGVTASGNFASTTGNTFTGSNTYQDNVKAQFGTGTDLQIYHDGTSSFISEHSAGNLLLRSDNYIVLEKNSGENMLRAQGDGAVDLWYDGSKKLETTSNGVKFTGTGTNSVQILGTGSYNLYSYHDSGGVGWATGTYGSYGELLYLDKSGSTARLYAAGELGLKVIGNGAVELYYDNAKKLETTSTGILIDGSNTTGSEVRGDFRFKSESSGTTKILWDGSGDLIKFFDNSKAVFGTSNDLQIYHDGSQSRIIESGTGGLRIGSDTGIELNKGTSENMVVALPDAEVRLFYDNSKKLETTSTGATVTGDLTVGTSDGEVKAGGFYFTNNIGSPMSSDGIRRSTTATMSFDVGSAEKMTLTSSGLSVGDNTKFIAGAGDDLQLLHDGSDSYLDHRLGSGLLRINATTGAEVRITTDGPETLAKFIPNGAVELYYDGTKKLETFSWGTQSYGTLALRDNDKLSVGTGEDLQIFHDGSNSYIKEAGTGNVIHEVTDATIEFKKGGSEHLAKFIPDGAVELYYDGSKQVQTFSSGLNWQDNKKAEFGNSGDLKIYHSGSDSRIINTTGDLKIRSQSLKLETTDAQEYIRCTADQDVKLFYDNVQKLNTTSTGVTIHGSVSPGTNNSYDLGTSSLRWNNIYVNDMHFSNHPENPNSVDGTWGDWTLQEGENDIFMLNNRTGKKYKMALTEVS